ncbi:hypothetical protein GQ42DRAFT_52421 [Ramicandelaber brevisporus]|nr:hypothetical protein GQ42DRAFT_52421 [Ramicandelaber brevisporus]
MNDLDPVEALPNDDDVLFWTPSRESAAATLRSAAEKASGKVLSSLRSVATRSASNNSRSSAIDDDDDSNDVNTVIDGIGSKNLGLNQFLAGDEWTKSKQNIYIALVVVLSVIYISTTIMYYLRVKRSHGHQRPRSASLVLFGAIVGWLMTMAYLFSSVFFREFPCFLILWASYFGFTLLWASIGARAIRYLMSVRISRAQMQHSLSFGGEYLRLGVVPNSPSHKRSGSKGLLRKVSAFFRRSSSDGGSTALAPTTAAATTVDGGDNAARPSADVRGRSSDDAPAGPNTNSDVSRVILDARKKQRWAYFLVAGAFVYSLIAVSVIHGVSPYYTLVPVTTRCRAGTQFIPLWIYYAAMLIASPILIHKLMRGGRDTLGIRNELLFCVAGIIISTPLYYLWEYVINRPRRFKFDSFLFKVIQIFLIHVFSIIVPLCSTYFGSGRFWNRSFAAIDKPQVMSSASGGDEHDTSSSGGPVPTGSPTTSSPPSAPAARYARGSPQVPVHTSPEVAALMRTPRLSRRSVALTGQLPGIGEIPQFPAQEGRVASGTGGFRPLPQRYTPAPLEVFARVLADPALFKLFKRFAAASFCTEYVMFLEEYQYLKAKVLMYYGLTDLVQSPQAPESTSGNNAAQRESNPFNFEPLRLDAGYLSGSSARTPSEPAGGEAASTARPQPPQMTQVRAETYRPSLDVQRNPHLATEGPAGFNLSLSEIRERRRSNMSMDTVTLSGSSISDIPSSAEAPPSPRIRPVGSAGQVLPDGSDRGTLGMGPGSEPSWSTSELDLGAPVGHRGADGLRGYFADDINTPWASSIHLPMAGASQPGVLGAPAGDAGASDNRMSIASFDAPSFSNATTAADHTTPMLPGVQPRQLGASTAALNPRASVATFFSSVSTLHGAEADAMAIVGVEHDVARLHRAFATLWNTSPPVRTIEETFMEHRHEIYRPPRDADVNASTDTLALRTHSRRRSSVQQMEEVTVESALFEDSDDEGMAPTQSQQQQQQQQQTTDGVTATVSENEQEELDNLSVIPAALRRDVEALFNAFIANSAIMEIPSLPSYLRSSISATIAFGAPFSLTIFDEVRDYVLESLFIVVLPGFSRIHALEVSNSLRMSAMQQAMIQQQQQQIAEMVEREYIRHHVPRLIPGQPYAVPQPGY